MDSDNIPIIRVVSTKRVFPEDPSSVPTTKRLSIIDNTVARFTLTASIWFYNRPDASLQEDVFPALEKSLARTLNDYRHFAGQLRWATAEEVRHTAVPRHLGRLVAEYGMPGDQGVELFRAEYDAMLVDVLSDRRDPTLLSTEFGDQLHVLNATDIPQHDFLPANKVALSSLGLVGGIPSVSIQLTAFRCGGFAVGIKMAHPLADAIGLMFFMRAWAAFSRNSMLEASTNRQGETAPFTPPPPPLLDPDRMDTLAGLVVSKGITTAAIPDQEKISTARALPMHRYDWWDLSAPGSPAWARASAEPTMPPPSALQGLLTLSPSQQPPWPSWDMAAPVKRVQILFPTSTVAHLKTMAENAVKNNMPRTTTSVSRLDSLLAHIWILINRARYPSANPADQEGTAGQNHQDEEVYLNMTLGLRTRFSPPLPDNFAGSPLLLAHAKQTASRLACSSSPETTLGAVAVSIRETIMQFTPEAVAAHVYDAAHEVSPQRLWQAFLGRRHTLVTSWIGLDTYELDFCGGVAGAGGARYVQAVMPTMDGLVHVVDVAGAAGALDVSLCLEQDAMERLLQDPALRVAGIDVKVS